MAKLSKRQRSKKKTNKEKKLDSVEAMKLLKSLPRKQISGKNIRTGTMVIFKYNAKDKKMIYDKTPCSIILWRTKTHTLGINLHWAPLGLREKIIDYIYKFNQNNIKNNKPLEITYQQMKPFLQMSGFIPIIRKYINSRMSNHGVIVPSDKMKIAARYSNEEFSVPKAEKLYKAAVKNFKLNRKKKRKK
jgi:hypothetical protein